MSTFTQHELDLILGIVAHFVKYVMYTQKCHGRVISM
jgi:hypothetical protein